MASIEPTCGISKPRGGVRVVSVVLAVAFGLLLIVLFARSAQIAASWPPTFDGAMNMEVARSMADGEGYRRNYAAREAFPHEIQTGVPYIVPSALVFKLWHVGLVQAEIVNIAYLALLLAMVYLLVTPLGGRALALFAGCTVIVVPGVHEYAFYGYGEIPALFYALAATVLYFHPSRTRWVPTALVAGILLALAFYTKTVMLIGVCSVCLCAGLEWLSTRDGLRSRRWKRLCALVVGGALSIVVIETWRAIAVGGFHAWLAWWRFETRNVFMQAGVGHGYGNFTHSLAHKFGVHFASLSHDYRTSLLFTGFWLVLLLFAVAMTLLRPVERRGKWTTLTLLTIAVVYMLWWLLITPTAKAWHRRVIDGMICADIGLVMFVVMWFRDPGIGVSRRSRKIAVLVLAALGLALPAMWLAKGSHLLLHPEVSRKTCDWHMADGAACARYNPPAGPDALLQVAQRVKELPANAYVFGLGWYSAPRVGLFSGRYMADFHDMPVARLQPGRPVYFVQGPDTPPSHLARIRAMYDITKTPDFSYALIQAYSLTPPPILPASAHVLRYVQAAQQYAYLRGLNRSEGANGRWLTDDNQVLLQPKPGDRFELVAYVLPIVSYEYPEAPKVRVSFDGCVAPAQDTVPGTVNHLLFAIPAGCDIALDRPVTIRIEVDNLVDSAITHDSRALGVLAKSFGFTLPP